MSVFIIAEAGSNHEGSLERAKRLIDIAVKSDADACKFQLIPPFKPEWIDELIEYCGGRIEFMATPFNQKGIDALKGKVKHWKVASTEAADPEFMKAILEAAGKDIVYVSDGAVDYTDYADNVIPLNCVVKYPAEEKDYAFNWYSPRGEYKPIRPWGLSDHTTSTIIAVLSVARGAVAIEKHFTDDKTREGPDHHYAANPEELKAYINMIRYVEKLLSNDKKLTITDHVGRKLEW